MTHERKSDPLPAVAEAALDETTLDDAIEQMSTSVSSESISRSGIQRLRILSESRLEKLVYDMVAARVKARPKQDETSRPATHQKNSPQEGTERADTQGDARQHAALPEDDAATHYAQLWKGHREKQLGRLRDLEGRIEKIGATFTKLEDSVEQVLQAVSKRAT